jgi:hypothetical protein
MHRDPETRIDRPTRSFHTWPSTTRPALALGCALFFSSAPALADGLTDPTTREASDEPTVTLHVRAPDGVAVERVDTGELVCTSPCDRDVPASALYRIGGARPSDSFMLDAHGGTAKISVDPASNRGFWTGAVALGGAGALIGSGVLAIALGYASQRPVPGPDGTVTDATYSDTMILGTVLVVAGMAAGIWGGATLASNLKSRVTGNIVKDPPARGTAQPLRTATTSGPSWSAGPTFHVPILGGVF